MSDEMIDEYYAVFVAQSAPFLEAVGSMATASEAMAASVTAAADAVLATTERMSAGVDLSMASLDEQLMAGRIEYDQLAAASAAASAEMQAAALRAAKSNEAITASIKKAGDEQQAAGLQQAKYLAIGAAGFGLITYGVVKMAADFQSSTTTLVTTAGETQAGLAKVRQGILDMTGQVGDSAEQLSKAMYTIESGGQHGADGLLVLRAAAEGAKAENADLGTVADAVTSILQDYHLKASDAANVTSKMVAAVGAGKTNFQDFAGALHSVLPIASSAHISLDDISGSMASMTVHGMSAAQAAENMADTIKHMLAPTQVQTKELGQLGMSSSELADMLSSKGLSGTLQSLSQTIMEHMGPSGRVMLNAFNQSKDAARDASIMMESMPKSVMAIASSYREGSISLGDWRKDLKALPSDQANLLTQFKSMQDRASGFNDVLKSGSPAAQTYQDALRRVTGDATGMNTALMLTGENTDYVNGAVKKVSGATSEAGGHVKGWSDVQKNFNQKMSEAKASTGAMAIEIGQNLLPALSTFMGWLADGAQWLGKHKTLATVLAVALAVLTVGFVIAAIAVWAMNSAFLANPITWIILAIVAAIALVTFGIYELVKHWGAIWGWVKDIALDVWHWLVKIWDDIVSAVKKFWQHDIVDPIKDGWNATWKFVKDAALAVWHWLVDTFNSLKKDVEDAWNRGVVLPIKQAWADVKKWTGDAVDFFRELPGKIIDFLKELPGKLKDKATEAAHEFFYAIGYGIGAVYKFFRDLPKNVVHELGELWAAIKKDVSEGKKAIVDGFEKIKTETIATVKRWWKDGVQAVEDGAKAFNKKVADLWQDTKDAFKKGKDDVIKFVVDLKNDAVAKVKEWWTDAVDAVKTGTTDTLKFLHDLPDKAIAFFEDMKTRAIAKAEEMVNKVAEWARSLPGKVKDGISSLGSTVKDAVSDAATWLYDAGKHIVEGAINGFKDKAKDMLNMVKGWGHDILKGFNDAVGNHSPSRLFATAGRFIVAGLVQGLTEAGPDAVGAITDLAGQMSLAPQVAVGIGASGGSGMAPVIPSQWRPPTPPGGGAMQERNIHIEVPVMLDGKEVYRAVVPHAQTHKERNGSTQLT